MTTPTIIIGLGTSGLRVIENVQKYYYENFKINKPSNVEYLYLETAESEYPDETPAGNEIKRAYISLNNLKEMLNNVNKRCDNPQWLPKAGTVLTAGLGAGGIRSCGRLALWGSNDNGDNFVNVIHCIQDAYKNVMHVNNNESSSNLIKPTVFITGSLTGGTGAGTFIDFGYIIRNIIDNIEHLYGLFLLPSNPATIFGNEVTYGNAYGAIYDLDWYNREGNKYIENWPNGEKKELDRPPYELVQYISQDYKDGSPAISNLSGLYKMAGLYLFLNIAGIYDKRQVRLVDAAGNSIIGKYGTFGLSAIQFPKESIQDFIATTMSSNLLKRLTNSKEYYGTNGQLTPINRGNIKNLIPKKMDDILLEAFKNLNNTGTSDLQIEMWKEVEKITNNTISDDKTDYIISLFSSNADDKFYSKVSGNMLMAQKIIVDGIYEMVDKALQNSENLYYAKFVLEDIVDYIDKLMDYWKSLGLSSYANKWDDKLRGEAEKCTKNTYKIVFEQNNVIYNRFQNILELMKMHLSVAILVNIKNHIRDGKIRIEGNTQELPKMQLFNNLIEKLTQIIGLVENNDKDTAKYNFEIRKRNILGDINDLTLPILRVYRSKDFNEDCKNGIALYENKNGKVRSLKTLKDIADFNLLDYFKAKSSGKFYQGIYLDLLNEYRKKVDMSNCVEDYDILEFINKNAVNKSQCVNTANRAFSPFIKVDGILEQNNKIPKFVVSNDKHKISNFINSIGNELKFKNEPDEQLELNGLNNIIVFYCENKINSPIDDITYIEQMKNAYEHCPKSVTGETDETWNKKRKAYLTN
jgi:hypothetical protein